MEGTIFGIFTAIGAVGTFLAGCVAVFGVFKYLNNIAIKNELLYGDEADERLKQIKNTLKKGSFVELEPVKYGGGNIKVPRLEIIKIASNAKTLDKTWRKHKAVVKYYKEDKTQRDNEAGRNVINIDRWLI